MIDKTYEFGCRLPAQVVVQRIEVLLSKEGVRYKTADTSVVSTRTPVAIVGVQPKLYTRSNWVGINPFTFVSGVKMHCDQKDNGVTQVTIRINRLRAFLWAVFWITCGVIVARAMPEPIGIIFVGAVACASWFGLVSFLGGHLVQKEISDALKE